MGYKSRGNFSVGVCLRDCRNQGNKKKCEVCIRFNKYVPVKEEDGRER